jgi:hypothetical protein
MSNEYQPIMHGMEMMSEMATVFNAAKVTPTDKELEDSVGNMSFEPAFYLGEELKKSISEVVTDSCSHEFGKEVIEDCILILLDAVVALSHTTTADKSVDKRKLDLIIELSSRMGKSASMA